MEHQEKIISIKGIFPKELVKDEVKHELNKIKKLVEKINRDDLKYETETCMHFSNSKLSDHLMKVLLIV